MIKSILVFSLYSLLIFVLTILFMIFGDQIKSFFGSMMNIILQSATLLTLFFAIYVYSEKRKIDDSLFALNKVEKSCDRALQALNNKSSKVHRSNWINAEIQIGIANDMISHITEKVHKKAWFSYKKSFVYDLYDSIKKIDECCANNDGSINYNKLLNYHKEKRISLKSLKRIFDFWKYCHDIKNMKGKQMITPGFEALYLLANNTMLMGDKLAIKVEGKKKRICK